MPVIGNNSSIFQDYDKTLPVLIPLFNDTSNNQEQTKLRELLTLNTNTSTNASNSINSISEMLFPSSEITQSSFSAQKQQKVQEFKNIAKQINEKKHSGLTMNTITEAIYPDLLEQVKNTTSQISSEQDDIKVRTHSIKPRIGNGYKLINKKVYDNYGNPAQASSVIFDRTNNLISALDNSGNVIMAFEARNNTRRHFEAKSDDWLEKKSVVVDSNAPAPNGIYSISSVIKSSSQSGSSFGSTVFRVKGGKMDDRAILVHSRDNRTKSEIPWAVNSNTMNSRTLGCILLQDYDLKLLGEIVKQTNDDVALVVQGKYSKNLSSPNFIEYGYNNSNSAIARLIN